ncbi:FAD-dependent oxidoreductase [Arthrobacter sp. SA17]
MLSHPPLSRSSGDTSVGSMREPASGRDTSVDVAVVGGGVMGHAIAWEAVLSGRSVALIDDAPVQAQAGPLPGCWLR